MMAGMQMTSLLPPNSTQLERGFEKAIESVVDQPIPIREIRRHDVTPEKYLPWLAWERSVDLWRDDWSIETQRKVIANSIPFHQKKGTVGALKRALAAEDWVADVEEWFEYNGPAYTFKVKINGSNRALNSDSYQGLLRTIDRAKNVRSWLTAFNITIQNSPATLWVGAVCISKSRMAVMPKTV
jgi:phage tail P2-like protein